MATRTCLTSLLIEVVKEHETATPKLHFFNLSILASAKKVIKGLSPEDLAAVHEELQNGEVELLMSAFNPKECFVLATVVGGVEKRTRDTKGAANVQAA